MTAQELFQSLINFFKGKDVVEYVTVFGDNQTEGTFCDRHDEFFFDKNGVKWIRRDIYESGKITR